MFLVKFVLINLAILSETRITKYLEFGFLSVKDYVRKTSFVNCIHKMNYVNKLGKPVLNLQLIDAI